MTTTTKPNFEVFAEACRYNSGKSMCDSGDYYGRHYERAKPKEDNPPVTLDVWNDGVTATIETTHFLTEAFDVDHELMARFNEWEKGQEGDWFELGKRFASEVLGMHQHARGNIYNGENDLSQVFVWEVWTAEKDVGDWLYAKNALVVLYIHTGCDVRGGYSYPLFVRHQGYYAIPTDFVAEFSAEEGKDADGVDLTRDQLQQLDESWRCGYSSLPSHQFSKDIEKVISRDDVNHVTVKLKSGETVKVGAYLPYMGT